MEKKSDALMILGKMKPKEHKEDKEMEGLDVAAEDILSAIEKKDKGALKSALKAFYDMCEEY